VARRRVKSRELPRVYEMMAMERHDPFALGGDHQQCAEYYARRKKDDIENCARRHKAEYMRRRRETNRPELADMDKHWVVGPDGWRKVETTGKSGNLLSGVTGLGMAMTYGLGPYALQKLRAAITPRVKMIAYGCEPPPFRRETDNVWYGAKPRDGDTAVHPSLQLTTPQEIGLWRRWFGRDTVLYETRQEVLEGRIIVKGAGFYTRLRPCNDAIPLTMQKDAVPLNKLKSIVTTTGEYDFVDLAVQGERLANNGVIEWQIARLKPNGKADYGRFVRLALKPTPPPESLVQFAVGPTAEDQKRSMRALLAPLVKSDNRGPFQDLASVLVTSDKVTVAGMLEAVTTHQRGLDAVTILRGEAPPQPL
jgi:hypothetical protein